MQNIYNIWVYIAEYLVQIPYKLAAFDLLRFSKIKEQISVN